ncbi:MAG: hypothetical protein AAGF71_13810 [Pseudomonadota bacterium]
MQTARSPFLNLRRLAIGLVCALCLAACEEPSIQDEPLARIFLMSPSALLAEATVPRGVSVDGYMDLSLVLTTLDPERIRTATFRLEPSSQEGENAYRLARKDRGRFFAFQERVMASLGSPAKVGVELNVPYCLDGREERVSGRPLAVISDSASDQVVMSQPAPQSLGALADDLPPCES